MIFDNEYFDKDYNNLNFDRVYHELENCLESYLKIRKNAGWTEKVNAFRAHTLPVIKNKKQLCILATELKDFSKTVYSTFYWMPGASGSSLQRSLEDFLKKIETEYSSYKENLSRIPVPTLPIAIPGASVTYEASPPSSLSKDASISASGPVEISPSPQLEPSSPPEVARVRSRKFVPEETKKFSHPKTC